MKNEKIFKKLQKQLDKLNKKINKDKYDDEDISQAYVISKRANFLYKSIEIGGKDNEKN